MTHKSTEQESIALPHDPNLKGPKELTEWGLEGYYYESDERINIPVISNFSGTGDFPSFLRAMERTGKTIFFVTVLNRRLESLLLRRDYKPAHVWAQALQEYVGGLALEK